MNSESQPRGYAWWQWVLGVLTFWPAIAMLIGTIAPSTRPTLTPKRIWIGYGIFVAVGFVLLIALVAVVGNSDQVSVPAKTQAYTFTCEDQIPEYNLLSPLGHDKALDYIAKNMSDRDSSDYVFSPREAEVLLEGCSGFVRASSAPPPARQHPLIEEFSCQWIMDNYRPMTMMGRDGATMHVSNAMNAKRMEQGVMSFSLVTVGDAAAALRECEAQGFQ